MSGRHETTMDQMQCEWALARLPGFVGDELPTAERDRLHAHLRDCNACRRTAASYQADARRLAAIAGAAGGAAMSAGDEDNLHADVMARIDRDRELQDRGLRDTVAGAAPADGSIRAGGRLALAAAALLLVAFGFWLAQPASIWHRQSTTPEVVPSAGPVRVVPYAGEPVELQPVGLDEDVRDGSAANGFGPGMMGRGRLRAPVEVEYVSGGR